MQGFTSVVRGMGEQFLQNVIDRGPLNLGTRPTETPLPEQQVDNTPNPQVPQHQQPPPQPAMVDDDNKTAEPEELRDEIEDHSRSKAGRAKLRQKIRKMAVWYSEKGWDDEVTDDDPPSLKWDALSVAHFKLFIAAHAKKENEMVMKGGSMRAYKQAIDFGAKEAGVKLSQEWTEQVEDYMKNYTKWAAAQGLKGKLEDHADEAMPCTMWMWLCLQFLKWGNVWMWLWCIIQWNTMSRSDNIMTLCWSRFLRSAAGDCMSVTWGKTKKDPMGAQTSPKHLYANPLAPELSLFLALGIYVATSAIDIGSPYVFPGLKSAASRFNNGLLNTLKKFPDKVLQFGSMASKIRSHSVRKGATSLACTGSTAGT